MADDDLPDLVGWLEGVARSRTALNGLVYLVIVLWLGTLAVALVSDPQRSGPVGDTFGALNTLFSGLALLGVAYAVLLERRQIDIARQDARAGEEARVKSEGLLSRQAEALWASAQLNAVNALLEAESPSDHRTIRVFVNGGVFHIPRTDVLRQRLRMVLHHIAPPQGEPAGLTTAGASMYRLYVLNLARDALAQLRTPEAESFAAFGRPLVYELQSELRTLLGHDGIAGSEDARFVSYCLVVLDGIDLTAPRDKETQNNHALLRGIEGALQTIEFQARHWR